MIGLRKLRPWSLWIILGQTNRQIIFSDIASAIVTESVVFKGMASEYFFKQSWTVEIYLFLFSFTGRGPTMSIWILWKAFRGVSVILMGSFFFFLSNFHLWQLSHDFTKFSMSCFAPSQKNLLRKRRYVFEIPRWPPMSRVSKLTNPLLSSFLLLSVVNLQSCEINSSHSYI